MLMEENFQGCNYLFRDKSDIVKQLPISIIPKNIEK